jgi:hypothetical protein
MRNAFISLVGDDSGCLAGIRRRYRKKLLYEIYVLVKKTSAAGEEREKQKK